MPDSEKDAAADEVAERRATFDLALSNKRKYPVQEFRAFVQAARRYIAMTKNDPMIHKSVARAVNGLREYLAVERKRIPGDLERPRSGHPRLPHHDDHPALLQHRQRPGLRLHGLQPAEDSARQIPRSELVRLPADRPLHPALPLPGARLGASAGRFPWTARDAVRLATGGGSGLRAGERARPARHRSPRPARAPNSLRHFNET